MIRFADELRELATDPRVQFGCVIFPLDCSSVESIGYNGWPRGMPHVDRPNELDTTNGSGLCHAEMNALTKLETSKPCLMFVHSTPCRRCAGQIINSGRIVGLIHEDPYIDGGAGLEMIQQVGIPTLHRRVISNAAVHTPYFIPTIMRWRNARAW